MNIQEIQTSLKTVFPTIEFKIIQNRGLSSRIYHKDKDIAFEVLFSLERNVLTITYSFGNIKSDYEAMFFINKFNDKTYANYKASIGHLDSINKDILIIRSLIYVNDPNQVPNLFIHATDRILENTEFQILKKRLIDEEKIKRMD